ncbi:MurR/RpiR family transcriptional regulator [Vagococcus xieshaowenii]|uniref:MurR/RpiR family transcriptional regulator n=1 Tax=Vagococcus xieshaowenii TaxID=2562451 RepID=A0A4Z0DCX9_9ENTE|nr:MurR/RpiR family transcriptional regulator [Vagococcus xieshaowenii]QCA28452.1 MurR/RpiR family transcriptional regulator [Vagococcus xieshaowenii]TFZ42793.1 MurR/RpiR family transcriptional regulator [Vagococcus xieshaowenii]
MNDYIDLIIGANFEKLTEVEKIIAQYFLDQKPALGIQELSKKLNVSNSSITRFCKKIGLSNYKELVYLYKNSVSSVDKELVESSLGYINLNYGLIIKAACERLSISEIKKAAMLIQGSRIIHFWGLGYNAFAGEDFKFKFSRLGKVVNIIKDKQSINMAAHSVQSGDLVVISTLSGNSQSMIEAVNVLKTKKVNVVLITANNATELKDFATVVCVTSAMDKRDTGIISPQIPVLLTIDAIYSEILTMYHEDILKSWVKSEQILKEEKWMKDYE